MNTIIGGPASDQDKQAKEMQNMMNSTRKELQVTDDEIVVCSKCESELFTSVIRLAKHKTMEIGKAVLGMVHEAPMVICSYCNNQLPAELDEVKTKKMLADEKAQEKTKAQSEDKKDE